MQFRLWPETRPLPLGRIGLVWVLLYALIVLINIRNLIEYRFPDPDDILRLVQVRDLLAGQGWYDFHQYRINPPHGTVMHWSRIVDLPIAGMLLVLTPLLGQAGAELAMLLLVPMLALGAILYLVSKMAARFFDDEAVWLSCLACGLVPVLALQVQPLRIDHHGWQIVLAAAAMVALLAPTARHGGWLAGLALAAGLSISVELLPFTTGFAAVLFLRWVFDSDQRWWLAHFQMALATGLVALFLLTRGIGDLSPYCDAIAPAHLGFFVIVAAGTWIIARLPVPTRPVLLSCFAVAGLVAFGLFVYAAPACISAPFGELHPLVKQNWHANVREGLPIWNQEISAAVPVMAQALVSMAIIIHLWRKSKDSEHQWWFSYLAMFCVTLATGILVWRSMAFVSLLCAVPLGWLTSRLIHILRATEQVSRQIGIIVAAPLLLMPGVPVLLAERLLDQADDAQPGNDAASIRKSGCEIERHAGLLRTLPVQTIFAPLDIGPAILLETPHSVVATGHHRANDAIRDVILAFTGSAHDAQTLIHGHEATMVVVCVDLAEPAVFERKAPHGFMAALKNGDIPAWLEPVDLGGPEELKAWKVVD